MDAQDVNCTTRTDLQRVLAAAMAPSSGHTVLRVRVRTSDSTVLPVKLIPPTPSPSRPAGSRFSLLLVLASLPVRAPLKRRALLPPSRPTSKV